MVQLLGVGGRDSSAAVLSLSRETGTVREMLGTVLQRLGTVLQLKF